MHILTHNRVFSGIVLMLLAVLVFSVMDASVKWLGAHYSPMQVAFFRGICSLPLICIWFLAQGQWRDLRTRNFHRHALRGVVSIVFLAAAVIGLREMQIVTVYSVFFLAPMVIAILSIFLLDEQVGWHRWSAIVLGFVGVVLALDPSATSFLELGVIACVVSVVGYSYNVVLMKQLTTTESTFALIFYLLLVLSVGSGLLALWDWHPVQWSHWPALTTLGVTGAIGQYFLTAAFQRAPASVLSPLEYTALIWGALLGFWFWGEQPSTNTYLGAVLIILSGLYLMYRESLHRGGSEPIQEGLVELEPLTDAQSLRGEAGSPVSENSAPSVTNSKSANQGR